MEVTTKSEKLLLKIDETAIMLSLGRATAYQMVNNGTMPGVVRLGRSVRISADALRNFVKEQASKAR
jgi:excisionase family DNA binding protein